MENNTPKQNNEFTATDYNTARWLLFRDYKLKEIKISPQIIYYFIAKTTKESAHEEIDDYYRRLHDPKSVDSTEIDNIEFKTFTKVIQVDESLRKKINFEKEKIRKAGSNDYNKNQEIKNRVVSV